MRTAFRGYRAAEVDAFLDRCAAALGVRAAQFPELEGRGGLASGAGLTSQAVADVAFPIAFRGYALDEVDALLDRVESALREGD